ncbi:MAG TPA: methyltransferase domain-containing protein [Streptosporangiaceae bacterium]|nr:methyltransferase domain-containing protein [Streptosporangiaceae bacterium]
MTAARLVARCVHGLEPTLAAEVVGRELGVITRIGHREVRFRLCGPPAEPRTADDVFLLAAERPDIGAARDAVDALAELADLADVDRLSRWRRRWAGAAAPAGVEVSASFLGRRNFNRYDAEDVVGAALARRLGVGYHSRRAGTAPPPGYRGWRLTLDGERATLMLRVTDRPLHRRAYKRRTIPGTLHPPLAAAMAAIADIRPGHHVIDPCCGAGTLLAEAAHLQPRAGLHGFDLDRTAVEAARTNAAGLPVTIERADAGRLPVPDGAADRVLCNPPWGGQAPARGALAASLEPWWSELRRVLAPGGAAVVLLPDAEGLAAAVRQRLSPEHVQRVRVAGAQPYVVQLHATAPHGRRGG